MTPDIFSSLFGIIVTELQGGTAYTTMQACPHGTVVGVKMIHFDTFDVTGGIHQAIGRVRGDGHSATEIVHKKAIGMPLAGVTPPPVHLQDATAEQLHPPMSASHPKWPWWLTSPPIPGPVTPVR